MATLATSAVRGRETGFKFYQPPLPARRPLAANISRDKRIFFDTMWIKFWEIIRANLEGLTCFQVGQGVVVGGGHPRIIYKLRISCDREFLNCRTTHPRGWQESLYRGWFTGREELLSLNLRANPWIIKGWIKKKKDFQALRLLQILYLIESINCDVKYVSKFIYIFIWSFQGSNNIINKNIKWLSLLSINDSLLSGVCQSIKIKFLLAIPVSYLLKMHFWKLNSVCQGW